MDGLVQCPFELSHRIRREKLSQHIIKCPGSRSSIQDNNPVKFQHLQRTLATCRFNTTHIVKKGELED